MAVYEKGFETKKNLVLTTYLLLQNRDASTITVREIAKLNKCSPAALYRHFDTLEYLILVASFKFLESYLQGYSKLMEEEPNLITQYMKGWELFNHYAFRRPDLYYRLLWGQYKADFSDAFMEYIELFPLNSKEETAGYFYTMVFSGDITERDYLLLRRMVTHGLVTESESKYYSFVNPLIVKGLLEEAMHLTEEECLEKEALCNQLLHYNMKDLLNRNS